MGLNTTNAFNKREQKLYAQRTGIVVDIQNIGNNTKLIAVKEMDNAHEIKPGVFLKKDAITFPDGNFTNRYDLFWNPNQIGITPTIHSSNKPYSLYDRTRRDTSAIAVINGSFFFLTDVADSKPHDLPYDFCIRDGKIFGLPSSDAPIIFIQNGKLHAKDAKARGGIAIAGKHIDWVGVKTKHKKKSKTMAVLYNSKCAKIIKFREEKTNVQIGVLDNSSITTPRDATVFDIVVAPDKKGALHVKNIRVGGGSHFHEGIFVLQMTGDARAFKKGDSVEPLTLDGLDIQTMTSGITVNKKVGDPYFSTIERAHERDARSIIAEDKNGYIHFIVFDGSKYIPGFNGVSSNDITQFFSPRKYKWAYFLDGGGSSRLIVREKRKLGIYANQFAFKKLKNGKFLWDWRRARKIASSISLHAVSS